MPRISHTIFFRLRQCAGLPAMRLRTLYCQLLGMTVGKGTLLPRICVSWPHQVSLGARCVLGCDLILTFDGPWKPGPSIVVGNAVHIGAGCQFNIQEKIVIGDETLIAAGCRFFDADHGFSSRSIPMYRQAVRRAPITIGPDVWLGANVVVLKGVSIGRGAIVGAGAVVTKSIPEFEIWAGVPARKLGVRPDGPKFATGG